ncbi:MAG TPA: ATP-binding protein [Candidatus Limnocylindrales bacterium]|nr:ATP-binding protein [Candidatus Limnocylindrales bacterium]
MTARLFVICGLPGSGKTTLARQLEAERAAVRFCPDDWFVFLQLDIWDQELRGRIEALQWGLAQRILELGGEVVIEFGSWARSERDELREGARRLSADVELRYLDPGFEELVRRVEARQGFDPPITRAHLEEWSRVIEVPTEAELALFDPPSGS